MTNTTHKMKSAQRGKKPNPEWLVKYEIHDLAEKMQIRKEVLRADAALSL
jgi:DNA-directed RNA polymerase subunit M/transcription elongation factor TFIIS